MIGVGGGQVGFGKQGQSWGGSTLSNMFGSGGGSMGNTQPLQQNQLTPMNINVQQDPAMAGILGEMQKQQKGLAAGNDIDATNALRRQQQMAAGNMRMYGAQAGARGFGPDSGIANMGRSRIMSQSGRDQAGLNANLTSDARRQQRDMLNSRAGATNMQAQNTLGQQNFALNQWQAQNQASLANRQMAEQQQQNNFNNQMSMAQFYTGLG